MIYTEPEPIRVPTSADTQRIDILLTELSSSVPPFSQTNLEAMLADPTTTIFPIRASGRIIGTPSFVIFCAATGLRAFVDDAVVADSHNGHRLGEALVRCDRSCRFLGVRKFALTSLPSRETVNLADARQLWVGYLELNADSEWRGTRPRASTMRTRALPRGMPVEGS